MYADGQANLQGFITRDSFRRFSTIAVILQTLTFRCSIYESRHENDKRAGTNVRAHRFLCLTKRRISIRTTEPRPESQGMAGRRTVVTQHATTR